jgi:hypothetical protein
LKRETVIQEKRKKKGVKNVQRNEGRRREVT